MSEAFSDFLVEENLKAFLTVSLTQCDRYGGNLSYTFGESYFWNLKIKIVSDYHQANLVREHSILLSVLSYLFVNLVAV